MADLSDVLNAIRDRCGSVLYPSGGSGPATGVGIPVLVAVGWPSPQSLDAAMTAGSAQLTIYPRTGMEQNTTRGLDDDESLSVNLATWALTLAGQTITVSGAPANPYAAQNLAALVNGQIYVAQTTGANDTASSLATALAAAINTGVPGTTSSGAAVTIPATARIGGVSVGVQGQVYTEVKRQRHQVQITAWCPTPESRDAIIKAIDPVLAAQTFLSMPDLTGARLRYAGTLYSDFDQKQAIFRRDLFYNVEYATIQTSAATQIVATKATVSGSNTPI